MAETIIYTIFAIFAVYGIYTAAREIVLFISRLAGKNKAQHGCDLCGGCRGCTENEDQAAEQENPSISDTCVSSDAEDDEVSPEDKDFFRT